MPTIDVQKLRKKLDRDCPIGLRPWTTDPEIIKDMVRSGKDRRKAKRPGPDRRKKDETG